MSYIYTLKDDLNFEQLAEKLKELGYEELPADITGGEGIDNLYTYYFKVAEQPRYGECVNQLIGFYEKLANKICYNEFARKAHSKMGIKYRKTNGVFHLVVNDELREMFSMWRVEIDLNSREIYFTISDGNMPRFYDAEKVLDVYCKPEIDLLKENNLIEKVEYSKVQ